MIEAITIQRVVLKPSTRLFTKKPMEEGIQSALRHLDQYPNAKLAAVARQYNVPRGRLRSRRAGYSPRTGLPAVNTKLSKPEELAICRYIDRLEQANLAVRPEFVTDAANAVLAARCSRSQVNLPTVGSKWTTRFLQRYKYNKVRQKSLDADRQAAEDLENIAEYFRRLEGVLQAEGIPPEDIWNMDETGFRIGCRKEQLFVTR